MRISEKTKAKEHRGEGVGAKYIPYIKTSEINSLGTTANPIDWKNGRTIQLLSQGELFLYYDLRWTDDVVDIREQFPLDLKLTLEIADANSIKHPKDRNTRMTTDMLVTMSNGLLKAYSVKNDKKVLNDDRTVEKLFIEKKYWEVKGIPYVLIYKDDIPQQRVSNIRRVVEYYDKNKIHDDVSRIKHLIATKQIKVNMDEPLDFKELVKLLP